MDEMTMDDLLNELQGLVDKYKADDGTDTEPTEQDAERMSALTAEIEKRNAAAAQRRDSHTATVAAARAAIENGTARRVDSVPLGLPRALAVPFHRCATPPTTTPPPAARG